MKTISIVGTSSKSSGIMSVLKDGGAERSFGKTLYTRKNKIGCDIRWSSSGRIIRFTVTVLLTWGQAA